MGIFSRLFKIGEAKANQMVDKMEKPELMLEQAIRDKEKQILEAKKAVQAVIASEREAKAVLNKERSEQKVWEGKAEAAVAAGNEELAVKALNRASEHEQRANSMETNWTAQREQVEKLKKEMIMLEGDLAEFKRNKDYIIAQSKTADVKKKIYEAKARMASDTSADDLLARMKAKAERSTFEAEAAEEMAQSFNGKDELEKEFENLGTTTATGAVAEKLAAMKAKMNKPA